MNIKNPVMIFGALVVILSGIAITYFTPFNILLMSRDNNFIHLGVNTSIFGLLIVVLNHIRIVILKKRGRDEEGKRSVLAQVIQW